MVNSEEKLSLVLQDGSEEFSIPAQLKRSTVLYFMRASNCPQCNRHARDINALSSELNEHSLDAIVIVPEDSNAAGKVKARNRLSIPVMAGNGAAHELAGLDKKVLGLIQQSATVVIGEDGTILYKQVATNPENSFNEQDFKQFLTTLS